ncbi:TrmH family RNA methyltransferase [Leucobacter sp. W1038]|uniref:TrmH family RNA methyltransferase n=1 Tax=Leucobacter sp. W1038 TaxID=3438281 RepID=UPI003D96165F
MENPKSPRVRRIAALARKKDRLLEGHFLVEGPQAVRELLTHRPDLTETVFVTTGNDPWQHEVDRLADAGDVLIERVTDQVLAAMAETVHPQGVIAVARIEEVSLSDALDGAKLVAIMHEVRDPGNAGTVLRAADAAGADAVIFAGDSIDPWHPKVVRSTTGSLFHLPVATASTLSEAVDAARAAGLSVLAADVRGDELTVANEALAGPVAWVFGNEARGLGETERGLTDRSLRLPIFGKAESLNLATAASVCLYTTAFAQRA